MSRAGRSVQRETGGMEKKSRILSAGEDGYTYSIRKVLLLSVACKAMLEACGRATDLTEG